MYACSGYLRAESHFLFSDYMKDNSHLKECTQSMCTDRSNSRNVVCGFLATVVVLAAFAFLSTLVMILHPRAGQDFYKPAAHNYS